MLQLRCQQVMMSHQKINTHTIVTYLKKKLKFILKANEIAYICYY